MNGQPQITSRPFKQSPFSQNLNMDKLSRLHALLGEGRVSETGDTETEPFLYHEPKPTHLYEGTDSDDDELIITGREHKTEEESWALAAIAEHAARPHIDLPTALKKYQLQLGQLSAENERFCPWQAVKRFPYVYVGSANRNRVAEGFFDQGKLYDRAWDFFYIHCHESNPNQPPLLLIPTEQFEAFLQTINQNLKIHLTIPTGGSNDGFQVTFETDGTSQPRYLGRATNREMVDNLRAAIPPSHFKLGDEPNAVRTPSDRSLAAFKAKIDLLLKIHKGKKLASKEKQRIDRIAKQQSWNNSIKRVQRYLGIRGASREKQLEVIRAGLDNSGLQWGEYDAAVKAAVAKLPASATFNSDNRAPYDQEDSVVFICIDVEAYERNASQITEIGIATLDTLDIKSLVPGVGGVNWMDVIRARHFRINEYKHLRNTEFVNGCPDSFEFGESEFINLRDAPHTVSTCFKYPFSKTGGNPSFEEDFPKRNIILVGHGVGADIQFFRTIGYEVKNLSNLQEVIDTVSMWQYLKRDSQPRNLGSILVELGIIGWNLHNAGNDAVYTLQAMIAISIKHLIERDKTQEAKELERKTGVAEFVQEATIMTREKEEGWSTDGENGDGGAPIAPPGPGANKGACTQPEANKPYAEGHWHAQNVSDNYNHLQNQGEFYSGAWQTPPAQSSGNHPYSQYNSSGETWRASVTASTDQPQYSSSSWGCMTPAEQTITPSFALSGSASAFSSYQTELEELMERTMMFTAESDDILDRRVAAENYHGIDRTNDEE